MLTPGGKTLDEVYLTFNVSLSALSETFTGNFPELNPSFLFSVRVHQASCGTYLTYNTQYGVPLGTYLGTAPELTEGLSIITVFSNIMVGLSAHFRFVQSLAVAQFQGRYAGVRGGGLKEGRDKTAVDGTALQRGD